MICKYLSFVTTSLLLVACGARSSLVDDDGSGGDAGIGGGASSARASSASTGGGVSCAPQVLGLDGRGGVRLELLGDTIVYTTSLGDLVRADLGPVGANTPPKETVLVKGGVSPGLLEVFDGLVYYGAMGDGAGVAIRRIPLTGGAGEDVILLDAPPSWVEVDATGTYVAVFDVFASYVVRAAPDGATTVLVDQLGIARPIALAGDVLLGFADTFPGSSTIGHLYSVPKLGGPARSVDAGHLGVDYVDVIDGLLYWYQPSSQVSGTEDLFTYDPRTEEVERRTALPDSAFTFAADGDRIYVTAIGDPRATTNVIYAVDKRGAVVARFEDGHPERFPTVIRAGGGRVAWTVQQNVGIETDVPSVQIECAAAFH